MAYDFVVVGGGIVGVATAWQLQQRYPKKCQTISTPHND